MITAEEAKRIADNARLKEQNEAEANVDRYLPTLYEIIKDAASKCQYDITISLGSQISENIYLMSNILISFECLEKKLNNKGFDVEILKSNYGLGDYMTISWGE